MKIIDLEGQYCNNNCRPTYFA